MTKNGKQTRTREKRVVLGTLRKIFDALDSHLHCCRLAGWTVYSCLWRVYGFAESCSVVNPYWDFAVFHDVSYSGWNKI